MSAPTVEGVGTALAGGPAAAITSRALNDARRLRALAHVALRDGMPKAELRASNARKAARSVLRHARQVSSLCAAPVAQTPLADNRCSTIDL